MGQLVPLHPGHKFEEKRLTTNLIKLVDAHGVAAVGPYTS
jgi:hypothetical protein